MADALAEEPGTNVVQLLGRVVLIYKRHPQKPKFEGKASRPPEPPKPPKTTHKKRSVIEVLGALRQRKVAVMLALGFSSGLPFLLTGNTFGYWLRDGGTSLLKAA